MKFTSRLLLMLNKQPDKMGFLIINLGDLIHNADGKFFKELGNYFAEISLIQQPMDNVKALVDFSLAQDYSAFAQHKHEVGYFLVKLMRLCNFTLHDSHRLQKFRQACVTLNIPWRGDVDQCIDGATFGRLAYMKNDGYVYVAMP